MSDLRKIGLVGGLAWPSTVDYYRLLCSRTNERHRAQGDPEPCPTPPMVIESVDISQTRALRGHPGDDASWERYETLFRDTLRRLAAAGAEVFAIASNTPHMRLDGITHGLEFPVTSILDATAEVTVSTGARRAVVLGTPVTMRSPAYHKALGRRGIDAPGIDDDAMIDALRRLIDETLYRGDIEDGRRWLMETCTRLHDHDDPQVFCLACTELPLAFPEHRDDAVFEIEGLTFVNTTVAHVEAILAVAAA